MAASYSDLFRGPFVNESSSSSKENSTNRSSHSFFIDDLIDYLENAYCARKPNSQVEYWVSRLRDGGADFSGVVDRIVASHPGRFTQSELVKWGHMRLRDLLKGKYSAAELAEMKTKIAQFSSIGSLGKHAQVWLCDEYLRSLCGGDTSNMNRMFIPLFTFYTTCFNPLGQKPNFFKTFLSLMLIVKYLPFN